MSTLIALRHATSSLRPTVARSLLSQTSNFHTTSITYKKRDDEPSFPTQRKRLEIPEHNPTPKPTRNHKINLPYVHLVADPIRAPTQLGPLRPLEEILSSVNLDEYAVELISKDPPTVKLVDLAKSRLETQVERQRAKKGAGQRPSSHKEVQLTWSMAEADETHKLSKVRQELEKGHFVDLVYSPKKGTKPPPKIEIQFKIKEILRRFEDVAREAKPATFDYRMGCLHLQPKNKVSAKVDVQSLKEVVPKSVLEHQKAVEKEQRRKAQAAGNAPPTEESYKELWGV